MRTTMKKFRQAAVLTATSLLGLGIAAQGPQYRGSNTDAMGRSGTASITGPSAMYLNPAGLAGLQGYGGEFELETSVKALGQQVGQIFGHPFHRRRLKWMAVHQPKRILKEIRSGQARRLAHAPICT